MRFLTAVGGCGGSGCEFVVRVYQGMNSTFVGWEVGRDHSLVGYCHSEAKIVQN